MKEQIDGHVKALRKASTQGGLSGIECNALADSLEKLFTAQTVVPTPVPAKAPKKGKDITAVTVEGAEKIVGDADTSEELDALEAAEKAGANRVGVLGLIERRREEIIEG